MGVRLNYVPVTIPVGASISVEPGHVAGLEVVGVYVPADWTAAKITFQEGGGAKPDGSGTFAFVDVEDAAGTVLELTATAGRRVQIPPGALSGCENLHIRSGTPSAPVAQLTADKTVVLICRRYE